MTPPPPHGGDRPDIRGDADTQTAHPPPHSAQPQHTNHWAPRTRKRHQQEHRPQRPTERSDPTQHAKGRRGDRPGPRKGATTRRNVTQGGLQGGRGGTQPPYNRCRPGPRKSLTSLSGSPAPRVMQRSTAPDLHQQRPTPALGDLKIALRGGGGGGDMDAYRRRRGGGVGEMGFPVGPFVLCKNGCPRRRRRTTNFGPKKFFPPIIPLPTFEKSK